MILLCAVLARIFMYYSLQLALSPSPRVPSEPIVVTLDTQFVLKVEGVIEHGQNPGKVTSIYSVSWFVYVIQSTPIIGDTLGTTS